MAERTLCRPILDKSKYEAAHAILREHLDSKGQDAHWPEVWECAAARGVIPESWIGHPRSFYGTSESPDATPYPRRAEAFARVCADVEGIEAAERAISPQPPTWVISGTLRLNTQDFKRRITEAVNRTGVWAEWYRTAADLKKRHVAAQELRPNIASALKDYTDHGVLLLAAEEFFAEREAKDLWMTGICQQASVWRLGYVPLWMKASLGMRTDAPPVFR